MGILISEMRTSAECSQSSRPCPFTLSGVHTNAAHACRHKKMWHWSVGEFLILYIACCCSSWHSY